MIWHLDWRFDNEQAKDWRIIKYEDADSAVLMNDLMSWLKI